MKLKQILYFSVGPIGSAVIGFISLPIMAWLFRPEDIGRLSMLDVLIGFSLMLFSLGLDQAYVREFHEESDKAELLRSAITPGILILLVAVSSVIISPFSFSYIVFGIESQLFTLILVFSIITSFFSRFLSLILRMQERGLAFSMSQLLPRIIFLVILLLYAIFIIEGSLLQLLSARFVSICTIFLFFLWNTRMDWYPSLFAKINKTKQIKMIRYAVPLIGSGLAFWGLTATDKIFLRSLSTFEELGVYSVAIKFSGIAIVFQQIFTTVWVPIVYKWTSDGVDVNKIKQVVDNLSITVLIVWTIAGAVTWIVPLILPPEYESVRVIILTSLAYPLLYTLTSGTGIGIGIKRKTKYSLIAAVIALIVNLLGNIWLIPDFGASGAAVSSAASFLIYFFIRTEVSSRIWVSFKRKKLYFITTVISINYICMNLFEPNDIVVVTFSLILFLLLILLYRKELLVLLKLLCSSNNSLP